MKRDRNQDAISVETDRSGFMKKQDLANGLKITVLGSNGIATNSGNRENTDSTKPEKRLTVNLPRTTAD